MNTLERIKRHPRVEHVATDDPCGPIVTLKQGWTFDPLQDNRCAGADTTTELLRMVRQRALPFAGPYDL